MDASSFQLPDFEFIKSNLLELKKDSLDKRAGASSFERTDEEALAILINIEKIQKIIIPGLNEYPSLLNMFESDFGNFARFIEQEEVINLLYWEEFLFPEEENYPLISHDCFNKELIESYFLTIEAWLEDKVKRHKDVQSWLTEKFNLEISFGSLGCSCLKCLADYRAKLRNILFDMSLEEIEKVKTWIDQNLETSSIKVISEKVLDLQRKTNNILRKGRNKLRKGSYNKLEKQVQREINNHFTSNSDWAAKYCDKLKELCYHILIKEGQPVDLVSPEEMERFFSQLETGIWKSENFIKREFLKLVRSMLMLKRKDISSEILQTYLGEFWTHPTSRILKRKIIYHMGPTNSGKTYHAVEALAAAKKGCYLAPLRLLAGELYDKLNSKGVVTTLLTGEEVIQKEGATHYSSTIEMARLQEEFDCVVIDEIQMITDPQRGWAWTRAFVNIFSPEIHLCGDPSALALIKQIIRLTGDELEIKQYQRMTKLVVETKTLTIGDLNYGDALVVFSRRNALKYKRDLESMGYKVSVVYGRLSPEVRREQARKFDENETDVMVSTDAIAMGMNLPVKRIVFSTLTKYFDEKEHEISPSEIKQIAGRAGRYGRYPVGHVSCLTRVKDGLEIINEALNLELDQSDYAMVGPDLEIFNSVNDALENHNLSKLSLSEFLRLFNSMVFRKPFFCVDLKEMIEVVEMVENADPDGHLSSSEAFGFACAPVNLGMIQHVEYFQYILNQFVAGNPIRNELIDVTSDNIDYLETSIKCIELFQWLSRHFNNKHFEYDDQDLLGNKGLAVDRLNDLLGEKIIRYCSSCGVKIPENEKFNICEKCFKNRRFSRRPRRRSEKNSEGKESAKKPRFKGKKSKKTSFGSHKKKRSKNSRKKNNNKKWN